MEWSWLIAALLRDEGEKNPKAFALADALRTELGPERVHEHAALAPFIKTIAIHEKWRFQLRADANAITNSPQFGNPTLSINSLNFGNISSASGNRIVTLEGRISF